LSSNQVGGICEKIRIRTYFYGWNVDLVVYGKGGLGKGIISFLYEEIMQEWKRICILEGRTIQGSV
jgi:hypothetical protein